MNKILSIAQITIKEELRNKVVYILLSVGFLLLFMARGCTPGKITLENSLVSANQILTMGIVLTFNCILFWGCSLCGLLAMNVLSRELTEETIILTITKPVKRSWFLLGKFLGILFIVFVNLMLLSTAFLLLLYVKTGVLKLSIFSGLMVVFLNFVFIISLTFLFSLFLPRVVSALFTLTIYAASLGVSIPFHFEKIRAYWEPSLSTQLFHYLLPQLGGVHLYASSFLSGFFPSSMGLWSVADVIGYTLVTWLAMVLIFQRKAI